MDFSVLKGKLSAFFTLKRFLKICLWSVIAFIGASVLSVLLYIFINPPITPLMVMRKNDVKKDGTSYGIEKEWVNLENISSNMVMAVVSAEDMNFYKHFGVDWDAIDDARKRNQKGKRIHGGSTITQQMVKNVFLVPNRSYIRKAFELYFTYLVEIFWSKDRIMEVYLNVIELGQGVYGVEAASQKFLYKSASKLSKEDAALITSVLPSPRKRNLAKPSAYMYKYQQRVLGIMSQSGGINMLRKKE